jgi:predicted double-glycine peptidase
MLKLPLLTLSCALLATSFVCAAPEAKAAYFYIGQGIDGGFHVKTKTFLDRRYHDVYRQRYDFSCGSAALASLLTYHYNRPTLEQNVLKVMYERGDQDKIRREGFSLLDMKNYLQSIGLRSNGYRESLDKLSTIGIPAIVLINRGGYMHFVLVQGLTKNKVLMGDPAQGKKIVDRKKFEKMWANGIIFVVEDDVQSGRSNFNTTATWGVKKPGKFNMPLPNTDLADLTLFTSWSPTVFK